MKKNTFILMAMTAIFGLSSCDKELFPVEDNNNENGIIYAYTESDATKTALSGNDTDGYQVVWSEGDEIGYATKKSTLKPYYTKFTLVSGAGTTKGTFVGRGALDNTKDYTLYYPYNFDANNWPKEQNYMENNITGSPMRAELKAGFSTDVPIQFENIGGILRLTIKGANTDTIKSITVNAKNPDTSITLDCSNEGNGVALSPDGVQFHIAMPSADGIITADENDELASYSGVIIDITDINGNVCTKKLKGELVIKRSMITKASFSVNESNFKTISYNVGDRVRFGTHEGIVVDLGVTFGKKVVATMNIGATSETDGDGCIGSKLSYMEALAEVWGGGWRLPATGELEDLFALENKSVRKDIGAKFTNEDWNDMFYGVTCWAFGDNVLYLPNYEVESDGYDKNSFNTIAKYRYTSPKGTSIIPHIQIKDGNEYSCIDMESGYRFYFGDKDEKCLVRLYHDLPQ